jgi:hypothetical protein
MAGYGRDLHAGSRAADRCPGLRSPGLMKLIQAGEYKCSDFITDGALRVARTCSVRGREEQSGLRTSPVNRLSARHKLPQTKSPCLARPRRIAGQVCK